jgi:putative copper export protein
MEAASYQLWFAVRYAHVASIALLTGGAFIVAALSISSAPPGEREIALAAAVIYEWAFWSVAGVTVATGVSNLGLKGEGLLGPHTQWGTALTVKLALVVLMLALSVVRSDFVIRWRAVTAAGASGRGRMTLGVMYGLTCALFLGAMWIGLGLAHGRY